MKDPEGVLEKQGPNSRYADMIRFTDEARVRQLEPVIRPYLREAVGYADAGTKPPKEEVELELPVELSEALEFDPELAEAFHKLTPGRKKSYVINLSAAKKPETRAARIATFGKRSSLAKAQPNVERGGRINHCSRPSVH